MTTRKAFLKNSGLALFGIGIGGVPGFIKAAALNQHKIGTVQGKHVLVCIFQRGAMDGLMAVTPFNDNYLKAARPTLFEAPTAGSNVIDLDGNYALHQGFKAFESLYRKKQLAIVHGIGSPNTTRSHFDAQDYMESGTPFAKGTPSGWLNRVVGLTPKNNTPFKAVSLTTSLPRSLYGNNPSIAINNLADFNVQLKGNKAGANLAAKSLEELYDNATSDLLKTTSKESFDAIKILQQTTNKKYQPANGAVYPVSALGSALQQIAQLIKMDVGLEVAFAEHGGWDTHVNQVTQFARNATDLSTSIAALWQDLGTQQQQVTIMTMTEFGRTVKQNGTNGTDHGRASCNFILGANVVGGKVYGTLPQLSTNNLADGRDLPVTTDFRTVFNEVATKHLYLLKNNILFEGYEAKQLGVLSS